MFFKRKGQGANSNDGRAITLPTHYIHSAAVLRVNHQSLGEVPQSLSESEIGQTVGHFTPMVWTRSFTNGSRTPPQVAKSWYDDGREAEQFNSDADSGFPILGLQSAYNGSGLHNG
jgi:hypothetical protein